MIDTRAFGINRVYPRENWRDSNQQGLRKTRLNDVLFVNVDKHSRKIEVISFKNSKLTIYWSF